MEVVVARAGMMRPAIRRACTRDEIQGGHIQIYTTQSTQVICVEARRLLMKDP